jgi:hypothetical protein
MTTDLTIHLGKGSDESVPIEIRGEAAAATHTKLQASPAQVALEANAAVQLWLSDSPAATRALWYIARFASQVRRRGRQITTHGASPTIRKMSAILGADRRLNLA